MNSNNILSVIFALISFSGLICITYEIYQLVVKDAKSRRIKHPKLWGLFSISGNNSSGLLLYLLKRKKHPISKLNENNLKEIQKNKQSLKIGIILLIIGIIGIICSNLK